MTTTHRKLNGATVRELRNALGIKAGDFALRCDMSPGYLSNIEAGRKQPAAPVIQTIAQQLGVPVDAITYPIEQVA
jgi:transcriptional regulator with XRE-family HTH domain